MGATATYTCNTGYTLNGNNTRTCQASGTWTGSDPTCNREFGVDYFKLRHGIKMYSWLYKIPYCLNYIKQEQCENRNVQKLSPGMRQY